MSTVADPHILSVTALAAQVKSLLEGRFGQIRVAGEISELKRASSGHVYVTLKDEKAILAAIIWAAGRRQLGLEPAVGMAVIATGRLTSYALQSRYQLIIERMELAGQGALLQMLEARKQKLAAEGLFAPERKRQLPMLPRKIGVITSATGAVIRDILHRLADRCPVPVLLWPVAVQGEAAAPQLVAAIIGMNNLLASERPDVLIVARGGGSVEDLLPFSDEAVVRAVAASTLPVISAVGHETDTTLIDYAADLRAPTPTAAAEMVVPVAAELRSGIAAALARQSQALVRQLQAQRELVRARLRLLATADRMLEPLQQRLDDKREQLTQAMQRLLVQLQQRLQVGVRLPSLLQQQIAQRQGQLQGWLRVLASATRSLLTSSQRVEQLEQRLQLAAGRSLQQHEQQVRHALALLESLAPTKVLQRGYAMIEQDGQVVMRAAQLPPQSKIAVRFADGTVKAVTEK